MALRTVEGRFWRVMRTDAAGRVLAPPVPESAGRYHRPGEPALYLSPRQDWARRAIVGYWREDGADRVAVPLDLGPVTLFDPAAEPAADTPTSGSWRLALAEGRSPPTWALSDRLRAEGAAGLVDPSRQIPGGWHVVLFRWNAPGAPVVAIAGPPRALAPPDPAGSGWAD